MIAFIGGDSIIHGGSRTGQWVCNAATSVAGEKIPLFIYKFLCIDPIDPMSVHLQLCAKDMIMTGVRVRQ